MMSTAAQSWAAQALFMWLTCYLENRRLYFLSTAMFPLINTMLHI